ncbi:MAG: protein kinase [Myxococcota bacterium]
MTLAYTDLVEQRENARLTGMVLEGRYVLGQPLGAGGMGTVYMARQLRLDRDVAIKLLAPTYAAHPEASARFLREAQVVSRIRHPNVVQVLDYGQSDEGLLYCVMEMLVGCDLEQMQYQLPEQRMPWQPACGVLAQIAAGLGAAHAKGVIHRDVKPANCFMTQDDPDDPIVKLLDFGVAKSMHGASGPKLTNSGHLIGTPSHIAPELLRTKKPATEASDLYSLGVVAYRLLSGRLPFVGDTLFAQMNAACFNDPDPLDEDELNVPPEVEMLVMQLLDKDAKRRPQSAHDVASRFRELAGLPPKANLITASHAIIPMAASLSTLLSAERPVFSETPGASYSNPGTTLIAEPTPEPLQGPATMLTPQPVLTPTEPPVAAPPKQRGGVALIAAAIATLGLGIGVAATEDAPPPAPAATSIAAAAPSTAPAPGPNVAREPEPEAAIEIVEPDPRTPAPSLAAQPERDPRTKRRPAKRRKRKPKPEPKASAGPKPDSAILRGLETRLRSTCARDLPMTLSFLVPASGKPMGTTVHGPDSAACARRVVSKARFEVREHTTPFKLEVK